MSKKPDPKDKKPESTITGVDPDVEAKVDAMMDLDVMKPDETDTKNPSKKIEVVTDEIVNETSDALKSTSAPLLPDEELPDFEVTNEPEADKKPEEALEETMPLVDEIVDNSAAAIEAPSKLEDEIGLQDKATEAAVDDIIAEDSDRILAIDDAKAELNASGAVLKNKSFFGRLKSKLATFWANPVNRRITFTAAFLIIAIIFIVPTSRYYALNLAGVRASTSVRIVDDKTGQPLKNVEVSLSGKSGKTDKDGEVKLEKVKLGRQNLIAKKPAFADRSQALTIGLGSNPIGDVSLTAVGSRYVFEVKDFLSDKPVDAEAISGEASARANEKGEIVLVIDDEKIESVEIQIVADHYRTENLTLPVGSKDKQNLQLVPSRKHAFVSKRSGKYDLYKIDVDGKNEKMILAGTGQEKEESMIILPHKSKDLVAFVSTRGDNFTKDGFARGSLNIIDLDNDEVTKIAESERIQLIDFIDDKLVYVKISEGESAASPNRHRLVSYDIEKEEEKELASTNYFNDVVSARGVIYYTPAEYQVNGQVGFYKIKPDGSGKQTIFGQEVWNLFRVSYHKIDASVQQAWYEYDIGSGQFNKLGGAPAVQKSRVYADDLSGINSAWVDERDGKGVLLLYNIETNQEDKVLQTQSGLRNPIRWLDDKHIVYRVSTTSETADYVISIEGGAPKRIIDVTNIAGLDRWYYY